MSLTAEQYLDFLDNPPPDWQPGELGRHEKWWVDRQQALEQAGYMLRPRYRPGWRPSWTGTNKYHLKFEDGQPLKVSVDSWVLVSFLNSSMDSRFPAPCRFGRDPDIGREARHVEKAPRERRSI
jgi:hypothetical protein